MASIKFTNPQAAFDIGRYFGLTAEQKGGEPICETHGQTPEIKAVKMDNKLDLSTGVPRAGAPETSVTIDGCCNDAIRAFAKHCRRAVRENKRA